MKNKLKGIIPVLLLILLAAFRLLGGDTADIEVIGGADGPTAIFVTDSERAPAKTIDEDGIYDSKEDVAEYIHLYGHLPSV